jgi:hypothetical protein
MKTSNLDLYTMVHTILSGLLGISEEEYEFMVSKLTEEEIGFLSDCMSFEPLPFSYKRRMVSLKQKYLPQMVDKT